MPLVKNNDARVVAVPGAKAGRSISLAPGVQEVSAEDWAIASKNSTVKKMLLPKSAADGRSPLLEVVGGGGGGSATGPSGGGQPATPQAAAPAPHPAVDLTDMKEDEAVALVSQTFDRGTLQGWAKDKRRAVREAAGKQLDAVRVGRQPPDEPTR